MKIPKSVFAATMALIAPGSVVVWAQSASDPGRYANGAHMIWSGGGWGMIFGPLFMILVLAVVIASVALLLRWFGGSSWQGPGTQQLPQVRTALDILKERYARGEIDKEEFEERRRTLTE